MTEFNIPEPSRPQMWKKSTVSLIILVLVVGSYLLGYFNGNKGLKFKADEFKIINQASAPKDVNYQLLWDAINVVDQKYIENKPTPEAYLYGAINGAVGATKDPYTAFFPPKELATFKSDLKGSFDGIGAEIGKRDGSLVIVAPLDGTPAQKAGLLARDIILEVDGLSTADWTVEEAVSKIRGKKGTPVVLKIFRQGKTFPFEVKIFRDKIEVKSVKVEIRTLKDGAKIGIVTLSRFGEDTKGLFENAINQILNSSTKGLIVDLRNNPGGYLETSVEIASAWVPEGDLVVTEERRDGQPTLYKALGNSRLSGIKTVILINGGSASASEILAGALHDHKLATLIGEKSFGKGSVQELIDLKDGGAVKVTVAKWVTPNGKNLNKEGLHPDIELKLTEQDITDGKDPQLDRAVEELIK